MQQNVAYSSHTKNSIPESVYETVQFQAQGSASPKTLNNNAVICSQQKRPLWGVTCVTMVVAVLALATAIVAIVLSSNIVGEDFKQEIQIIQLELNTLNQVLNTKVNNSNHEIRNLQEELLRLTEKIVLSANGEKYIMYIIVVEW